MHFRSATQSYRRWLRAHGQPGAGRGKDEAMRASPFALLRGSYYRWAQRFPALCPEAHAAPVVLAIGDLHVENYGTWRDAEGRLVWGINDFDEVHPLPYTNDLVRLATSAALALPDEKPADLCTPVLDGYAGYLESGGSPYVLSAEHTWLRDLVTAGARDPVKFWRKLEDAKPYGPVPAVPRRLLKAALPEEATDVRFVRREGAGLGALGCVRVTALAQWRGGWVAREVKALLPSATGWAAGEADLAPEPQLQRLLTGARRSPDPFFAVHPGWTVRRLSPYCSRVELADMADTEAGMPRDLERLLRAMGRELANAHLASPKAVPAIRRDLARRPGKWLLRAVRTMVEATRADFAAFAG